MRETFPCPLLFKQTFVSVLFLGVWEELSIQSGTTLRWEFILLGCIFQSESFWHKNRKNNMQIESKEHKTGERSHVSLQDWHHHRISSHGYLIIKPKTVSYVSHRTQVADFVCKHSSNSKFFLFVISTLATAVSLKKNKSLCNLRKHR